MDITCSLSLESSAESLKILIFKVLLQSCFGHFVLTLEKPEFMC